MPVGFSYFNEADGGGRNAKSSSNCGMRSGHISDRFCLFIGEFSVWPALAVLFSLSFLCDHIRKIISAGSKPQMIGIDAGRNIAAMADKKTIRDRSAMGNPSRSVGGQPLSIKAEHSIAAMDFIGVPQNAAIWLWLRMKSQFLGKRNLARREAISTFWFSQDRLRSAIAVRVGYGVCALFRPANYSTIP